MELTNVKHMFPRRDNVAVVSRACKVGLCPVEGRWQGRGLSSRATGGQASLSVAVPAGAQCGASGTLGCPAGSGGGSRVEVGLSRTSASLGWAGLERGTLAWPGQGTLEPGSGLLTTRQEGASGWGPVQEGRAPPTVWVSPKGRGPSLTADAHWGPLTPHPVFTPTLTVASAVQALCQLGEIKPPHKAPGSTSLQPPYQPLTPQGAVSSLWFPAVRGLLQQRVAGPALSQGTGDLQSSGSFV